MSNNVKHTTKSIGDIGEAEASEYLQARGLKEVESNWRHDHGEIDLIMRDGDCLVFVEVRLRFNPNYGHSLETISRQKQQKVRQTAKFYLLKTKQYGKVDCRFDVIGISAGHQITWVKDAF